MNPSFKNVVLASIVAASTIFGFSNSASAQIIFGALNAEAGTYPPISLGENVNLSACGSVFEAGSGSFDLCAAPTVDDIAFSWFISNDATSAFTVLTGAVLSLTSGGFGDFFSVAGTYSVNLNISATTPPINIGPFTFRDINLGGAGTGRISGSTGDNDFTSFTIEVASVPEPESLLVLLPALFYVARRQRRRFGKIPAKIA